jgi:hypothetical protein
MPVPRLAESSRSHLAEVGEGYFAHMRFAAAVGSMLVAAGFACLVHALVPGVCRNTGSRTIACLHRVIDDRSSLGEARLQTMEAVAFALLTGMALALGAVVWTIGALALPALAVTLLALALPITLLATNPDLEYGEGEPLPAE